MNTIRVLKGLFDIHLYLWCIKNPMLIAINEQIIKGFTGKFYLMDLSLSFIIYQIQLDLAFKTFDIWLILRESLYFSCRTSNLFFLLLSTKKVDGYSNTHVYIYSNKPVFDRQTDQTVCTGNSCIINSFCLIGCEPNKMTKLTFNNCLTIDSYSFSCKKAIELEMACVLTISFLKNEACIV
mgnify:CR=1 FL=1